MQHRTTFTLITMAGLASGCGNPYAHCDPSSPLHPGITDQQRDECEDHRCDWDPDDPSCADESGDTGKPDDDLTCRDDAANYLSPFCWLTSTANGAEPINAVHVDADDCQSTSTPLAHVENFATPVRSLYAGSRRSVWCSRAGEHGATFGGDAGPSPTGPAWNICENGGGHASGYHGGDQVYYPATATPYSEGPWWSERTLCAEYTDRISTCDIGLVAVGGEDPSRPEQWTCECESDDDCQVGSVCEAGVYLDGIHPTPSLCTWSDAFEQGPPIYGLEQWSDGVRVDARRIRMSVPTYIRAFEQVGLWNDAQEFEPLDESGLAWTVTRCDPESLCHHVGLAEGDEIAFTLGAAAAIPLGQDAAFTVRRGDEVQTWTLSLGFD